MTKKERYWSKHLAAIAAEGITTKAYAEREGLSADSLYYWRKRLKEEASAEAGAIHSAKRQLVPVQVAPSSSSRARCTLTLVPGVHLELAQLPDPQWLASLAAATARPVR
jgi:transposase